MIGSDRTYAQCDRIKGDKATYEDVEVIVYAILAYPQVISIMRCPFLRTCWKAEWLLDSRSFPFVSEQGV